MSRKTLGDEIILFTSDWSSLDKCKLEIIGTCDLVLGQSDVSEAVQKPHGTEIAAVCQHQFVERRALFYTTMHGWKPAFILGSHCQKSLNACFQTCSVCWHLVALENQIFGERKAFVIQHLLFHWFHCMLWCPLQCLEVEHYWYLFWFYLRFPSPPLKKL